jgi:phosphatidylglycerol---prolipoprotein diacylglyceryl transferase
MLKYPHFDPIAVSLGPLKIRWYGIMYLIGFLGGWWVARRRAARPGSTWTPLDVDDLIFYAAIGVIAGGRIGWLLVYGRDVVAMSLLNVFKIWDGGMSFHGGLTGVMIATAIFARQRGKHILDVFDFLAPLPGIGLAAGRIGNFINGELWGKPTDLPWGMWVEDPLTGFGMVRHPSQLYEAGLEGVLLFAILYWYTARPRPRGAPSGLFLVIYGLARLSVEFVRLPDANIGYLYGGWLTMGMLLTLPMLAAGAALLLLAYGRRIPSGNVAASAA